CIRDRNVTGVQTCALPILSGASPLGLAGRGAFQEMDQAAAAAPVTKAAWMASKAERLSEDIAIALDLAKSGRPGPVHVSLPGDRSEERRVGKEARGWRGVE